MEKLLEKTQKGWKLLENVKEVNLVEIESKKNHGWKLYRKLMVEFFYIVYIKIS